MPRVMVISDGAGPGRGAVLMDEQVRSIHLDSDHSAWQFIERLGWAISDAEEKPHASALFEQRQARSIAA